MALDISQFNKNKKTERSAIQAEKKSEGEWWQRDLDIFGGSFNDKKKEKFFSEFQLLLSSGVDLRTAFEIFISQVTNKKELEVYREIEAQTIKGGVKLWQSLQQSGKFSEYEFNSVRLGEESGKLKEVFDELSAYFNRKIKQRRQFVNAIATPALVFTASLGVLVFMLNYVVPVFADMYKKLGGELPKLTRVIIHMSDFLKNYGIWSIIGLILIVMFFYYNKQKLWFRKATSQLLLRIPVIRNLVVKIYLARFCSSMSMLLMAYTPLEKALLLVKNMVGFYPLETSLEDVRKSVIDGKGFFNGLSQHKIYPKQLIALVQIGEKVNQLGTVFDKLARQYNDEVDKQSDTMGKLLEPLLILLIGGMVGFIIIAMYLPMFKMNTLIHH